MKSLIAAAVLAISLLLPEAALTSEPARIQVIDLNDNPVAEAVVFVTGPADGASLPPRSIVVDQIDKAFVPRVSAVQIGGRVEFPNSDSVGHHVYSFANPNDFELPLYRDELRPSVTFDHSGLAVLGCNIHDSMLGYIMVVDTPHFAVTDDSGFAELSGVSADTELDSLQVWSPELNQEEPMRLIPVTTTDNPAVLRLRVSVTVPSPEKVTGGSLLWDDY